MDLTKHYGIKVFNDSVMSQRLSPETYESLKLTQKMGRELDNSIAGEVAAAMRDWAIENGATHYSHWFQPMTNITAGKHDAFLMPENQNDTVIMEFSSKQLVQGEPDASSFPNGGLRTTFEARGYTTWDPTSPAFIRDQCLYIPTAFCTYTGFALDTKTPQLRSMEALNKQGIRLLRALGNTTSRRLIPYCGNEQEYFLVDRERYEQRLDLKLCGRTLFGAKPAKTQELEDHYCGRIRIRISEFMHDLDQRLWELGIPAKTEHNEAAPAQHELASVFGVANVDCDRNQMIMENLRVTAKEHGLACLLHEKPFRGINGSGKHHNYSIVTDDGINLLAPGKNPETNLLFQLVLCAFIQAVDENGDLLRLATATPNNDFRLGGFEAPPAIISMFLGDYLQNILYRTAQGAGSVNGDREYLRIGVTALPSVLKDDADRNRTSPFAFTGNKFEFRMVGSTQSPAVPNTVMNTILAEVFEQFAERLEKAGEQGREAEIVAIIRDTLQKHERILFNGNNYTKEWEEEAKRRGLPISKTALDAAQAYLADKNIKLFEKQHVLSQAECESRYEIMVENVEKVIGIEANVMLEMTNRQILPAVISYLGDAAASYENLTRLNIYNDMLEQRVKTLSALCEQIGKNCAALQAMMDTAQNLGECTKRARYLVDEVRPQMEQLREACDKAELLVDATYWPIPTYTDLLHRV